MGDLVKLGGLSDRLAAVERESADQRAIVEQMANVINDLTIRLKAVYTTQQEMIEPAPTSWPLVKDISILERVEDRLTQVEGIASGNRRDYTSLARTVTQTLGGVNNVHMRLVAYERNVPVIAKVHQAMTQKALREEKARMAKVALAAAPESGEQEASA